jgi:5-(carboxyamino)imidazole ribonucleotide mutase
MSNKVLIIMGSDSDFPVMEKCLKTLDGFGIEYEVHACSAHRTPEKAATLSRDAVKNGFELIIAAAGMAAHLPGVMAAFTPLPVIGVPIKSPVMDGLDSLFSIVQMPPGVPVATVAVNGSVNAAVLAAQIIGVKSEEMQKKVIEYKEDMEKKVEQKNIALNEKVKGMN